jgi:uncharacterized protein (TIGR02271 family)
MSQTKSEWDEHQQVIPVIEEVLDVQKRRVETGGVRINKKVSEREERIDEPVWQEEVDVRRVAINRVVDGPAPESRTEGDVMIVPVLEEVVVVKKQLVLKEELHITRRRIAERDSRTVTLRREEATVERIEPVDRQAREENIPRQQKENS